ncbi:hypothetical protein D3C78_1510260 [compost metagenome]
MHGHAGRLVDYQQRLVLVHDREIGAGHHLAVGRLGGEADRRNAQFVALLQALHRVGTALVHADLAGADDAVNMAFRHALEQAGQVVVQALIGTVFVDGDECNGIFANVSHIAYTPLAPSPEIVRCVAHRKWVADNTACGAAAQQKPAGRTLVLT